MMVDLWELMAKERQQVILDWVDQQQLVRQASPGGKPFRRMVRWVAERMSAFNIRITKGRRTVQSGDTMSSVSTHL